MDEKRATFLAKLAEGASVDAAATAAQIGRPMVGLRLARARVLVAKLASPEQS
jgi:hypothetical protein